MSRKNPPKLVWSSMTNEVYIVTRYTEKPADGYLVAHEKYDVTAQFESIVAKRDVRS